MQESGEELQRISEKEAINLLNTLDPSVVQDFLRQKRISSPKTLNLSFLPEHSLSEISSPTKVPSIVTPERDIDATSEIQSVMSSVMRTPGALQKLSLRQGEATKSGIISRKKISEPAVQCSALTEVTLKWRVRSFLEEVMKPLQHILWISTHMPTVTSYWKHHHMKMNTWSGEALQAFV